MSRDKARLLAVSLCCLTLLALAAEGAHAQDTISKVAAEVEDKKEPEANSVIYGRAVYDETARPVRRARIRLQSFDALGPGRESLGAGVAGLTNANGEFRIEHVAAGDYLIFVDAPGILTPASFTEYDGAMGNEDLDAIVKYFAEVKVDGKAGREVAVRARLGAAISGKVTYADGDPVPGAQVSVKSRRGGRDMPLGAGGKISATQTDERGRFHVSALPPGEYVVAASELVAHGDSSNEQVTPSAIIVTYHPSETKKDRAGTVTVGAGEEREGVDITIAERETHAIYGFVRGRRDGRPLTGARVEFHSRGEDDAYVAMYSRYGYGPNVVTTDEQGRFRFGEMPDGEYVIGVTPPSEDDAVEIDGDDVVASEENVATVRRAPEPPKHDYAPARRTVTLAGGDVGDVAFVLADAGRITGTLKMEGGKPLPENRYVLAMKDEGGGERPSVFNGGFEGDEFRIEGLPAGRYTLYSNYYDPEKGDLFVKSVAWHGRDLMREPLELKEGEAADGVSIVFAPGRASLSLRLYARADKTPARGFYVALISTDPAQRYRTDLPYCYTDRAGACVISGAPGEYALVAYSPDERAIVLDDKETARRAASAPRVTLRAGKPGSFELVLPGGN